LKYKSEASVGIVVNDNKVLVIKRKNEPFNGYWAFPGGAKDRRDKSFEECLKRELKEELGKGIKILHKLADILIDEGQKHVVRAQFFLVKFVDFNGKLTCNSEISEWKFVNPIKLPQKMPPHQRELLKVCKCCGNIFERYVQLGKEKFPVWMHDYPTLEKCKALRFKQDFIKRLEERRKMVEKMLHHIETKSLGESSAVAEQWAVVRASEERTGNEATR